MASAIRLAVKGYEVSVYESNDYPGGKLTQIRLGAFRFDAGPSLFTMPQLVDELFRLAGKDPKNHFRYQKLPVTANYFYDDGAVLHGHSDAEMLAAELEEKLGEPRQNTLSGLQHSAFLYDHLGELFIHRPLSRPSTFFNQAAFRAYTQLHKLGLFETMNEANARRFKSPKTIQLFNRYATYNGSDPYQTPATMNIIPHLEFGIGAFIPENGMHQITESLYRLALELGVQFHFNHRVDRILHRRGTVAGLTADGRAHHHRYVICNADMVSAYKKLLPDLRAPDRLIKQPKSSSGLIFYWGIKREFGQLDLHNIFFSSDYKREFESIFHRRSIYDDPTVYVNITSKYVVGDAPPGKENWFTMINVPHNSGQDWQTLKDVARQRILEKLERTLGTEVEALIEEEASLDPVTIEQKTSSWQGALYGNSSNNKYAAFLRHANKSRRLNNLFFCGGSVHPGGGIPLCLASAKLVAGYFPDLK